MTPAARLGLVAAAFALAAPILAQRGAEMPITLGEQQIDLAKALGKFPDILAELKKKPAPQIKAPQDVQILVRFIQGQLPPIPLTSQGLSGTITGNDKFLKNLSPTQQATIAGWTKSVGRIERKLANGEFELIGTGFVAKGRHVVTNCHVMRKIGTKTKTGWVIPANADVFIDFAPDPAHSGHDEFQLTSVTNYPPTAGLDAALLTVSQTSAVAGGILPPDLKLRSARGAAAYRGDEVLVVGYPAIKGLTVSPTDTSSFAEMVRQQATVAKVASPGPLAGLNGKHGFDVLLHLASTFEGQSGSPVIDKNEGEVLGVHSCCTAVGKPNAVSVSADPPCSSVLFNDYENQAIAAWAVPPAPLPKPAPFLSRPRR